MSRFRDFLEPAHIRLLEHTSNAEVVDAPSVPHHALPGLDGVLLRSVVKIPLLEIPMRILPAWEVSTHLEVERDRDTRLAGSGNGNRPREGAQRW
jgi:hypothetical protein